MAFLSSLNAGTHSGGQVTVMAPPGRPARSLSCWERTRGCASGRGASGWPLPPAGQREERRQQAGQKGNQDKHSADG